MIGLGLLNAHMNATVLDSELCQRQALVNFRRRAVCGRTARTVRRGAAGNTTCLTPGKLECQCASSLLYTGREYRPLRGSLKVKCVTPVNFGVGSHRFTQPGG